MPSDSCETPAGAAEALDGVDGVLIPGGFGIRGIEGKLGAITHARTRRIPTLGLCLGLQCMVIETARTVAGLEGASSTEFDPETAHPVISTMATQRDVVAGERDMGGTMRLGAYPAVLQPGSVAAKAYGRARSPSGTGTASRSTTPTGSSSPRQVWCSGPPGRHLGGVRGAAVVAAPVLRRDRRTRSSRAARPGRTRCSRRS